MSPVTPRALNERLSYSPSTMIGARRFFSVRSSRTRCKSSWSCSQSIGSLTERPADDKGCAQEAIIYRPPDMRIVPGEEEVNFERVTKVYREESGKKTLVALEADFYDKLASYIARLDESANKEAQKDPNSPKALLLQDELGRCASGATRSSPIGNVSSPCSRRVERAAPRSTCRTCPPRSEACSMGWSPSSGRAARTLSVDRRCSHPWNPGCRHRPRRDPRLRRKNQSG